MAQNRERAKKAVESMLVFGFNKKLTVKVLQNLLKVYEGNWELIEDGNYQALLDAIIESQPKSNNGGTGTVENPEPNEKKTHSTRNSDTGPHAPGPSSSVPQEDETEETETDLLLRKNSRRITETPAHHPNDDVMPAQHDDMAIVLAPPQHQEAELGQIITYQRSLKSKRKLNGNGIVIREPKSEDQPLAFILPNSGNQENQERETPITIDTPSSSQNPNPNPNSNSQNPNSSSSNDMESVPDQTGTIQLGSSSNGLVNLVFTFQNPNPNFPSLNLDEYFQRVENQCLKSFKSINPNFSLPNFLNDMCQIISDQIRTTNSIQSETGTETETGTDLIPNPNSNLSQIRPIHDISDICKGLERIAIPILNQYNSITYPIHFNYISQNFPYQNAYLHFNFSRISDQNCCSDCYGNCISKIPCSCASNTNGEFRYNDEGILKKEFIDEIVGFNWEKDSNKNKVFCEGLECKFEICEKLECKGHLMRKFIKECWIKCGCNMNCMNRIVQRGIMCRLQVFMTSDERGWGLQTLDEIPKGTFVCEFIGEILTKNELNKRYESNKNYGKNVNIVKLDADFQTIEGQNGLFIDPTFHANVSRFINHRCCDSNLVEIPVEIESPDHHYYHVALFTTRKIEALEELTWDYGIDFMGNENTGNGFLCKCGSQYCRNIQRSRKRARRN